VAFGGPALEELRWYLEDYLQAPFGVWEQRGPRIQAGLAGWGAAVFASVFGPGPARDAYQRARDRGLELVFRSAEPGWLGLPWELMDDGAGPAALGLAGVSRALRVADQVPTAQVAGDRLRVLMVISRPAGNRPIPSHHTQYTRTCNCQIPPWRRGNRVTAPPDPNCGDNQPNRPSLVTTKWSPSQRPEPLPSSGQLASLPDALPINTCTHRRWLGSRQIGKPAFRNHHCRRGSGRRQKQSKPVIVIWSTR
jgi:hypothetical protein